MKIKQFLRTELILQIAIIILFIYSYYISISVTNGWGIFLITYIIIFWNSIYQLFRVAFSLVFSTNLVKMLSCLYLFNFGFILYFFKQRNENLLVIFVAICYLLYIVITTIKLNNSKIESSKIEVIPENTPEKMN